MVAETGLDQSFDFVEHFLVAEAVVGTAVVAAEAVAGTAVAAHRSCHNLLEAELHSLVDHFAYKLDFLAGKSGVYFQEPAAYFVEDSLEKMGIQDYLQHQDIA